MTRVGCPIGRFAEHLEDNNGISIYVVHNSPIYTSISDSEFVTSVSD